MGWLSGSVPESYITFLMLPPPNKISVDVGVHQRLVGRCCADGFGSNLAIKNTLLKSVHVLYGHGKRANNLFAK